MRGSEVGTASRRGEVSHYVEFWRQPLLWWLIFWTYHYLWVKATEPLVLILSNWLEDRHIGEDDYIPLAIRRRITSHYLHDKNRTAVAIIYITREQHDILLGYKTLETEPRHKIEEPVKPPSPEDI